MPEQIVESPKKATNRLAIQIGERKLNVPKINLTMFRKASPENRNIVEGEFEPWAEKEWDCLRKRYVELETGRQYLEEMKTGLVRNEECARRAYLEAKADYGRSMQKCKESTGRINETVKALVEMSDEYKSMMEQLVADLDRISEGMEEISECGKEAGGFVERLMVAVNNRHSVDIKVIAAGIASAVEDSLCAKYGNGVAVTVNADAVDGIGDNLLDYAIEREGKINNDLEFMKGIIEIVSDCVYAHHLRLRQLDGRLDALNEGEAEGQGRPVEDRAAEARRLKGGNDLVRVKNIAGFLFPPVYALSPHEVDARLLKAGEIRIEKLDAEIMNRGKDRAADMQKVACELKNAKNRKYAYERLPRHLEKMMKGNTGALADRYKPQVADRVVEACTKLAIAMKQLYGTEEAIFDIVDCAIGAYRSLPILNEEEKVAYAHAEEARACFEKAENDYSHARRALSMLVGENRPVSRLLADVEMELKAVRGKARKAHGVKEDGGNCAQNEDEELHRMIMEEEKEKRRKAYEEAALNGNSTKAECADKCAWRIKIDYSEDARNDLEKMNRNERKKFERKIDAIHTIGKPDKFKNSPDADIFKLKVDERARVVYEIVPNGRGLEYRIVRCFKKSQHDNEYAAFWTKEMWSG